MRRWSVRSTQARFTVTAGALIFNDANEVLLLKHRFRTGSGWGIPGGFLEHGEQPEQALRRELGEEIGLEVHRADVFTRGGVGFRSGCPGSGGVKAKTMKFNRADWSAFRPLPAGLPQDQRLLIERAT